jgi:hypothetical protein
VFVQWGWGYLTRDRSARLITGRLDSLVDQTGEQAGRQAR